MRESWPALFRVHFRSEVIVLCVRWYLRYPLSYRDLEEMMAERRIGNRSLDDCPLGFVLRANSKSADSTGDGFGGRLQNDAKIR
jgi:hypothetical protein